MALWGYLTCHACLVWKTHKSYLTEHNGHGPNSCLKIRMRLSSRRISMKQHSICYRFPCRAPSYLSNILLLLNAGHLEKRQVTGIAVPFSSLRVRCPLLSSWSQSALGRWCLSVLLPLLVPATRSPWWSPSIQSSYDSFLCQSMINDGHHCNIFKTKYCIL